MWSKNIWLLKKHATRRFEKKSVYWKVSFLAPKKKYVKLHCVILSVCIAKQIIKLCRVSARRLSINDRHNSI
jgi:hypothetical protein